MPPRCHLVDKRLKFRGDAAMVRDMKPIADLVGPNLVTYDPYDLWKTKFGIWLKKLYYQKGKITIPLVAPFFILDVYAPKLVRMFIKPQEYPIVRALAALSALNFHKITSEKRYLELASDSVTWLIENRSPGYHGACWGLNFPWETKGGHYPSSTPFVTHTPYCIEALLMFHDVTGDPRALEVALSSLAFLEEDLHVLIDEPEILAMSYGPGPESIAVVNANSYAMMLYALLAQRLVGQRAALLGKAARLCNFVKSRQNDDGSWFYYDGKVKGNFIDCFHSCFVLTNLIKYARLTGADVMPAADTGLRYVLDNFIDNERFLARRFIVAANPSLTKYDLYDQAELLNLLVITGHSAHADRIYDSIMENFYIRGKRTFGYQIDIFGSLKKMRFLRWAVMPTVYAMSQYHLSED